MFAAAVAVGILLVEGLIVLALLWVTGQWHEETQQAKDEARRARLKKAIAALKATACDELEPGCCPEYEDLLKAS